jgi:hypothetical protein
MLGRNVIELPEDTYRLVWVTKAHPPDDAFIEDFNVVVTTADGRREVEVREVRMPSVLPVDDSGENYYFEVADFEIDEAGRYEIVIDTVAAVPPGRPALYR